jgi:hypothetical protein
MKTSEKTDIIIPALAEAQKHIGAAEKNVDNTYYDVKYADLGSVLVAIKRPLNDQGIFIIQTVEGDAEKPWILTRLQHESGQFIEMTTPLIVHTYGKEDTTQAFGKATTLTRRYALQTLLSVPSVEDERLYVEEVIEHKNGGKKTDAQIIQEMIDDHEERINDPETFPEEKKRLINVREQLKVNLNLELERQKNKPQEESKERPTRSTGSRRNAPATPSDAKVATNTEKTNGEAMEEMKGWKGYRLVGYTNPVYKDKRLGELKTEHIKMLWTNKGEKNQNSTDPDKATEAAWIREAAVDMGIIKE